MKISTRAKLMVLSSLGILILFGLVMVVSYQEVSRSNKEEEVARGIYQKTFDLNTLTNDYLLNRNERSRKQWWSVYDGLGKILAPAEFDNLKEKAVLENIVSCHTLIGDIFANMLLNYEKAKAAQEEALFRDMEKRLISQLLLESRSIVTFAEELAKIVTEEKVVVQQRSEVVGGSFIVFLFLIILLNSLWLRRSIIRPITKLYQGTEIIGSGNLDFKVATQAKDELGQLSRAFDEMTARLQKEMLERKKALDEANAIKKRLEDVMASMLDGVTITDMNGKILSINKAVVEQHGCTEEEVMGKTPVEVFMPKEEMPKFLETMEALRSGETIIGREFVGRRKDGSTFIGSVNCSFLKDAKGNPIAIISVHRDITERKKMETELKNKMQELERFNKVAVGRELKMIELKDKIAELEEKVARNKEG